MWRRLLRQRRRLVWLSLCLLLAAVYRLGPVPAVLAAPLLGLVPGIALLLLRPQSRTMLESTGAGFAIAALLPVPTMALPFLIPGVAWMADSLLYGTWWDRTRLRVGLISRQTATLHGTPQHLWPRLVPGEGHPDDHWTGTLIDYDTDPDDSLTIYLRHSAPGTLPEEMTLTFLEREPPRQCRYMLERHTSGAGDEAMVTLTLAPGGGPLTHATSTLHHTALTPRLALARWLDDALGDEWDSLTATLARHRDWSITGLGRAHDTTPAITPWPQDWPAPPAPRDQSGAISPSARRA